MKYKNIFFDLDDTLWAFSENARDTFEEMYHTYNFDRFFDSFDHYYAFYEEQNLKLWELYGRKEITKEELNHQRFSYPLNQVEVYDDQLVKTYMDNFFDVIPTKKKLMPYTEEILEYLAPRYNLYILSNGFRELQSKKMKASGIEGYFKKVILSEDIGVMKPYPEIFYFALSATQSELKETLMIGDNFVNDIQGANEVGMDQVYYNLDNDENLAFHPTYVIAQLDELKEDLL